VTTRKTPSGLFAASPAARTILAALALLAAAAFPTAAFADHRVRPGFGGWWLPYDYSTHGYAIDGLFNAIFWITMITFIIVELVLVVFLVKYRSRPERVKAKFIHGNTRLEMAWTLAPAVILAVLALASKHVWDRYRYADEYDDPSVKRAEVLVIGEQFKWNFVYPGKDQKLGQYLVFPKPSDPDFRSTEQSKVAAKINAAIIDNPLGQNQNFEDPAAKDGADDDYDHQPGRPLILPVEQPITVKLSSKDVIHDFFLPNFRVKLDALPGMAGRIDFTARKDGQSTEDLPVSDKLVGLPIWIDAHTRGAIRVNDANISQIHYSLKLGDMTIDSRTSLTPEHIAALKAANYDKVTVITKPYDLVCEELCGQGHYSMAGIVFFVSKQQYADFLLKPEPLGPPTTRPSVTSIK
jgi:cytochrome c oxidase subunit 2